MKTLNLTVKNAQLSGSNYNAINLEIDLNDSELDTVEVAECISKETFFEAHGEASMREYVESNYDWFDKED